MMLWLVGSIAIVPDSELPTNSDSDGSIAPLDGLWLGVLIALLSC